MIRLLGSGLISPPSVRLDGPICYIRPPLPRDWRGRGGLR
ncbi:GCN5 family acetyltransferase, partial [Azospirillum sp. TSH58]